jgi:hypothetical protein
MLRSFDPRNYLAPALIVLAATEVHYWHLHGILCLFFVIAAGAARIWVHQPCAGPIVQMRGVIATVRHLNKNLHDAEEQMDGVIALLDATNSRAPERAERLAEIVQERGVHAICEALVQHPDTSSFVVPAYQLLNRLMLAKETRNDIIDAFNIDSLMDSIIAPMRVWIGDQQRVRKETPPDPTLISKGFGVISLIVDSHQEMQDGAAELRVPELLVQAFNLLAKFPEALAQFGPAGLRCLFNTCFRHAECKYQLVVELDGLHTILRVLVLLPVSRDAQLHGLGLLFDCLSEMRDTDLPKLRASAVEMGILPILASARKNFSNEQTIVESAAQMEKELSSFAGMLTANGRGLPPDTGDRIRGLAGGSW